MKPVASIFYGCDGSRLSIQHRQVGQDPCWTPSAFLPCRELIHLASWTQKMSYAGVISYQPLQKASGIQMGLASHAVPKMVKITSCTMSAGMFSNDVLIPTLIEPQVL